MLFNDFLANPTNPQFADIPSAHDFKSLDYDASLRDKNLGRTFVAASKASFATKTDPSMACSRRLGNMYTASLYGCLASLIACVSPADLSGRRISMYAFGGGCAASFFTARVKGDTSQIRETMDLVDRLPNMKVVSPQEFVDALQLREKNHNAKDLTPEGSVINIWPGAYYLEEVDDKYRRKGKRNTLNLAGMAPTTKPAKGASSPNRTGYKSMSITEGASLDGFVFKGHVRKQYKDRIIPAPDHGLIYMTVPARKETPPETEALDGWCEALVDSDTQRVLQAVNPVSLPRNSTPAYRIGPVPGKGLGMIATRDLQAGDLIVAERPLVMAPKGIPISKEEFPDGISAMATVKEYMEARMIASERHFETLLSRMTPERRVAYEGLDERARPALSGSHDDGGTYYLVVFDDISRMNHSCRPNARPFFDTELFAMFIRPVRPIRAGEELCISYCYLTSLYDERKADLASYGFECTCESCKDPVASDMRRMEISMLSQVGGSFSGNPAAILKETLRRIVLIRKEGLESLKAADAKETSDRLSRALLGSSAVS
ncbi:hypothetical protein K525DRAFT_266806 [Schizophyllum commune Loenen D]|nr:hypothetical protein K525DRAFT_266806 [Schizophyllum commune Loenen D]